MIYTSADNAPTLFREMLHRMRICGKEENSRNGPVLSIPNPTMFSLNNPLLRVITDPQRDANPFFHAMEFVWMMAGSNDITWIAQFNKRMMEFSDDHVTQHGAYGYRWRNHWMMDQIRTAIKMLNHNPQDRRVVVSMWDPDNDLNHKGVDIPCNTQLMFRVVNGRLNMLVTNRSNDLIWGAMGSNIVHFTMLQELVANATRIPIGKYTVVSNNLHIYKSIPSYDYYMGGAYQEDNVYNVGLNVVDTYIPLLQSGELYRDFAQDCEALVDGESSFITYWMNNVGYPIHKAWFERTDSNLEQIATPDWRIACVEWVNRRRAAVGNIVGDNNARMDGGKQTSQSVVAGYQQSNAMAGVDNPQPDVGSTPVESSADGNVHP